MELNSSLTEYSVDDLLSSLALKSLRKIHLEVRVPGFMSGLCCFYRWFGFGKMTEPLCASLHHL